MKQKLYFFIKFVLKSFFSFISSSKVGTSKVGSYINEVIINDVMNRVLSVNHQGTHLKF
jgi:hypothetical protein